MKKLILAFAAIALSTSAAVAHHTGAMFDRSVTVELTGTIIEYSYKSPHVWFYIDVEGEDGEVTTWAAEGNAPYNMRSRGIVPSVVTPGLEVMMRIHPLRDGRPAGSFIDMVLPDGTKLSGSR